MQKTPATTTYATERLYHLRIVAGVCREIGLEPSSSTPKLPTRARRLASARLP